MQELKPCPFCGDNAFMKSLDRFITIGCKRCHYDMSFPGVLTIVPHGEPVSHPNSAITEYYNPNAKKEAIEIWNRRV